MENNKSDIYNLFNILEDSIDDIEAWSANNADMLNEEVHAIRTILTEMRRQTI